MILTGLERGRAAVSGMRSTGKRRLQRLHFVRNRAAHHEPIRRGDLAADLRAAEEVAEGVAPTVGTWVRSISTLDEIIRSKP